MPEPPAWLRQNFPMITNYFAMPCETTAYVYVEALAGALTNAILTLVAFDMGDVLRGHFRPESVRRWRHGRKGRKGYFKKAFIPETGEVVAKWIEGSDPIPGHWEEESAKWLWEVDGVFQRIGYFWMVMNIVGDFWYDLNTGIVSAPESDCGDLDRLNRKGAPAWTGVQGWNVLDLDELIWQQNIDSDNFGCVVGDGSFVAILASNIHNKQVIHEELTCGVRLWISSFVQSKVEYGAIATIPHGATHTSIARATFEGPANISWEGFKEGAECDFLNTTVVVFKTSKPTS